jgi:hypothetical protein
MIDDEVQLIKLLHPLQQLVNGSTVYFPAGKQGQLVPSLFSPSQDFREDEFGFGSCFPHSVLFPNP